MRIPEGFIRGFTTVRGARIYHVSGGAGEPVLLVAGWPQSWYCWRKVMPLLANRYRVIAIDPPGLGDSEAPRDGYDTANIAHCIDDLLDTLGVARINFIGHDLGAWFGYAYAVRYPARVARLALIEAAVPGLAPAAAFAFERTRVAKNWHFFFNVQPDLPEALIAGRERIYLDWLFKNRCATPGAIDAEALDEYVRVYSAPGAMARGFGYYRAMFDSIEQNLATKAVPLDMPLLAVGGERWLGRAIETAMASVATRMRGEVIPGCAHFPPEETPDVLARMIEELLQERP